MPSSGDYGYYRKQYQDISGTKAFGTGDGNQTLITGVASYTVYVQRIIVSIATSAAQAITFQDSANTPVIVEGIAANPAVNSRTDFDFGPIGKPLTEAKNLAMAMNAGNAGHVEWYAYLKQSSTLSLPVTPSNGLN